MHPINGHAQIMLQQNNYQLPWIIHRQAQRNKSAGSKKNIDTFLYYSRDVDFTMLPSIRTIAEQQSNPAKNTEAAIRQFLNYAATNPSPIIQ